MASTSIAKNGEKIKKVKINVINNSMNKKYFSVDVICISILYHNMMAVEK